jgi:membrane protease YdiL (CAAX protease family)
MRLSLLVTPPLKARIDAPWDLGNIVGGLVAVAAIVAATVGALSLVFDEPTPLWAVLASTLPLDAVMLVTAARLGPGRLGALTSLLGPRRLAALPLYAWASVAFFASLAGGALYVTLVSNISRDLVPLPLPAALEGTELRWLMFIVVVLVGPFVEEVFFRGFVFAGLLRRFGLPAAVVLSSLVFALAHLDVAVAGPAFLSGSAFALVYWRTGTLQPLILAHTAQNAIAFALSA